MTRRITRHITRTLFALTTVTLASACRTASPVIAPPTAVIATADNTGLFGTYDANNAFARIIRGELPVSKVYEDEHVLAFMPLRMISPGHVLDVVTRVARAEVTALGIQGFQILQNNGAVGTQSVFHLHVHVIPRYPGVALLPAVGPNDDRKDLDAMAQRIRAAMK